MRVSKEQIKAAKETDLVSFLSFMYPELIVQRGSYYYHAEHDSLLISPEAWYRFSNGDGGDTIEFLVRFCGKSFQQAVKELCSFNGVRQPITEAKYERSKTTIRPDLPVPKAMGSSDEVIRYLELRGIKREITLELIKAGLLYQARGRQNNSFLAVFYNPGKIAISKGVKDLTKLGDGLGYSFEQVVSRLPNQYWEFVPGKNRKRIFVCEAPIDALSLYQLYKENAAYIAMAGLKPNTLKHIRVDNPDSEIILAVDWDEPGKKFSETNSDYKTIRPKNPGPTKDWNEYLLLKIASEA